MTTPAQSRTAFVAAKFEPHWLGRAMAVEDTGDRAKVGVLYAAAEGFLDVPVIGPLLTPKPA